MNKFDDSISSILFSLNGKISKSDFNRIKKFYNWKFDYKKIHIVGTNGKGTNAHFLNEELIEQGYNVGLFTSPHINSMYERIKINNSEIDFERIVRFFSELKINFIDINFGFFDVFFLLALKWFEDSNIDVAIFEAGIGAKKDVVNYLKHDITLITSISIDHENILGETINKIASDKVYSIKKNNHIYINGLIRNDIINIFKKRAIKQNNKNFNVVKTSDKTYQNTNQTLSKTILKKEFYIKKFKSNFILPQGRAQKIIINKNESYIDIAHNVESINESIKYFNFYKINFDQVVVSLSNDKDHKSILKILENKYNNIFVFENNGRKPLKLNEYESKYKRVYNINEFIKKIDKKTLFIGSFYFASQVMKGIDENKKY